MTSPIKVTIAALVAATLAFAGGGFAGAQMSAATPGHAYPSISGEMVRGIEEINNSGQVGTATLTQQPDKTTHVILTMKGAGGKAETAAIYRSNDATCNKLVAKADFTLSPLSGGKSSTMVPITRERLLSGNYFIDVKDGSKRVACGHLVHE